MARLTRKEVFSKTKVMTNPSLKAVKIAEKVIKQVEREEKLRNSGKKNIVNFRENITPELKEYYKGNKGLEEIARKHNMTATNLSKYMDIFGMPRGKRKKNVFKSMPLEKQKAMSEKQSEKAKKEWENRTSMKKREMVDKRITTNRLRKIQIFQENKPHFKSAIESIRKGVNPAEVEISLIKKGVLKSESRKIVDKAVATVIREIEENL